MADSVSIYKPVDGMWKNCEGWKYCELLGRAVLIDKFGDSVDWVRVPSGMEVEAVIAHHCEHTHAWKYAIDFNQARMAV